MSVIPPILHAYWEAPAPPCWLRLQTLESWRRLHPEHEVRLHQRRCEPADVRGGRDGTCRAQASDIYRWEQLLEHGGWWTDLDVIYWRSPRDLVAATRDFWLTLDGAPDQPLSIGLLAAAPGSELVAAILEEAIAAEGQRDYQACGVHAVRRALAATGARPGGIPHDALYVRPALHAAMARLWLQDAPPPATTHGLHWYGGHPISRKLAPLVGPETHGRMTRTPIWRALQRSGCVRLHR